MNDIDPDRGRQHDEADREDHAGIDAGHGAAGRELSPHDRQQQRREVRACGNGKGQADHEGHVLAFEQNAEQDRGNAQADRCDLGDLHFFLLSRHPPADHAHIEVMGERRCAGQREARDDRQDRCKGDRGQEPEEGCSAERFGKQGSGHVAALVDAHDDLLAHEHCGAEADGHGEDVEVADKAGCDEHRFPRLLGVGDGVEAHQDVRQSGRAEHERQAERERVNGIGDEPAGLHELLGIERLRLAEQLGVAEVELRKGQDHEHRGAAQKQDGLDDLHPGGGEHAAEEHVHDHERADGHQRHFEGQSEHELDERAGADHLRNEVKEHRGERTGCRSRANGPLLETECDHVGKGVLAQVPERFGDEEHDDGPAHEPAHGIDEAVKAFGRHQPGDAEERCRAHVVAGKGEAVLETGDAPACRVELLRGARPLGCPVGDAERDQHEEKEENDRCCVYLSYCRLRHD